MFHVGQNDEWHGVKVKADPSQGQHIRVVEILHTKRLIYKLINVYLPGAVLC